MPELNKIYWTISHSSEDAEAYDNSPREPYEVKLVEVYNRFDWLYYQFACFNAETGEPDLDTNASVRLSASELEKFIFETEKAALSAFIAAKEIEIEHLKAQILIDTAHISRLKEVLANS